jgi:hypothetical protein
MKMGFRQIARSGLVLIALSMPLGFSGCSGEVSGPAKKPTASQEDYSQMELRALRAEAELKDTQDKLKDKNEQYTKLEKEREELEKTKDELIDRSHEFPIDTPEHVIKTIEKLRRQDAKRNVVFEIGSTDYDRMQKKYGELLTKVAVLNKQIEKVRPYLERMHPPKYFSEITGDEIPEGLTPYNILSGENDNLRRELEIERKRNKSLDLTLDGKVEEMREKFSNYYADQVDSLRKLKAAYSRRVRYTLRLEESFPQEDIRTLKKSYGIKD